MENRINIAELLKDCPKGMELDCTIWDNIIFEEIDENNIVIFRKSADAKVYLTQYGEFNSIDGKCVIFPKGKTTWEGFIPPCKFKEGDVLVSKAGNIVLFSHIDSENMIHYHCIIPTYDNFRVEKNTNVGVGRYYECTLANEQQRQRMYDRIKRSGYKYNQSTNKLEKLIEPKFKIGDKVLWIHDNKIERTIVKIKSTTNQNYLYWILGGICSLGWCCEDELIPVSNKFDITTLKPFESRVLVKPEINSFWMPSFFGFYKKDTDVPFVCCNGYAYKYCIPYEGNEHLLGTTDDCDEFYKTWE